MGGSSSRKMETSYSSVKVPSKEKATAVLIFLHGLGDTGHGWAEMLREFSLKTTKCICPNAPIKPVSLNGGMPMPSWFDIRSLSPNGPEDEEGIKQAAKNLKAMINEEIANGIPAERILIGGFSQGGAVALYTAFATDVKVAGVVALSTWLPLNKKFAESGAKGNTNIPVFQCHGEADPMVSIRWGQATHDIVKKFCPAATFKTYSNLGHSSSPQEMTDVRSFLTSVIKDS